MFRRLREGLKSSWMKNGIHLGLILNNLKAFKQKTNRKVVVFLGAFMGF